MIGNGSRHSVVVITSLRSGISVEVIVVLRLVLTCEVWNLNFLEFNSTLARDNVQQVTILLAIECDTNTILSSSSSSSTSVNVDFSILRWLNLDD